MGVERRSTYGSILHPRPASVEAALAPNPTPLFERVAFLLGCILRVAHLRADSLRFPEAETLRLNTVPGRELARSLGGRRNEMVDFTFGMADVS